MEGRWTLAGDTRTGYWGSPVASGPPIIGDPVPAVPCDDAAIERVARKLHEMDPLGVVDDWVHVSHARKKYYISLATLALRAAGETP